jgi:hypothetical protein
LENYKILNKRENEKMFEMIQNMSTEGQRRNQNPHQTNPNMDNPRLRLIGASVSDNVR